MRKSILFFLTCCFAITHNVNAQKIYKSKLNIAEYATRLSSNENKVKQAVHASFQSLKDVTVIDFTNTATNEFSTYRSGLQKYLKSEDFFSINNASAFISTIKQKPEALTVILPHKNKSLIIDLIPSEIFSDNFKVFTDKNPEGLQEETSAYYRGTVRGTNASASISFFEDQVEGYITLDQNTSIEITKLRGSNSTNQHAIYDDADLLVKGRGHYCDVLNPPASEMQKTHVDPNANKTDGTQLPCVTNYWETAYSVFQHFGSSKNVSAFVKSLFNVYATLYANESISMKLNAVFIWTNTDPYNDDLNTFSGTRSGFGANTAVLLSNAAKGGVAWLNTICGSTEYYHHAYCGSIARYESIMPFTTYTWPVMVACHEVGHNLGSPHTHACVWNGNNTAIDGCGPAAGYNEGCTGPIPKKGGTVMSYCHLVSAGINLNLGFGPQPGDLIRNTINTCITATCSPITKKCKAPGNLIASDISTTTATVSWKAVPGAAYYYVELSGDNGVTYTTVADHLYLNSFALTSLKKNHTYIVAVWVVCGAGTSNSSNVSFTTTSAFAGIDYNNMPSLSFSVLPNPIRGNSFTVMLKKGFENSVVEVVTGSNQVIYRSRNNTSSRTFMAPQTKGIYYIRVIHGDNVMSEKILIE